MIKIKNNCFSILIKGRNSRQYNETDVYSNSGSRVNESPLYMIE